MCGIVGYIGNKNSKDILIGGLSELEYRGYDSAGIAILTNGKIDTFKAIGKLVNLEEKVKDLEVDGLSVGIGHTRWATHGSPTELNAHPHLGEFSYVVHNGIIENYKELKESLISDGVKFLSQTDTEVIVHLYEKNFAKLDDELKAFEKTISQLDGAYAILLITKSDDKKIFFAKHGSPMIVGNSEDEIYFGSSDAALLGKASEVIYLEDGEYGYTSFGEIKLFNKDEEVALNKKPLVGDKISAQKSGFRFFMEKEIYEQSDVLSDAILGRVSDDKIIFDELESDFFDSVNHIKICACGTSYHSALSASYLLERDAKIPTTVEIASEFRYKEPLLSLDTLFIVISQSGETADTLEALKMAKRAGLKTLAICNVDNSSIVRGADFSIMTRAGIEKGVASTKAFATQVIVLWMLSLYLAQKRDSITKDKLQDEIKAIKHIPAATIVKDELHQQLKRLSKRYLHGHGFFFIGRDIFFPLALEGALKLKEISYLHAEGYPAGEMKHGPIALADSELFTVALIPKTLLYDKVKSNVEELCARDVTLLAISPEPFDLADDFIKTDSHTHPMGEFFEMMVVTQLLALEISIRVGNDVDMPRNLAKSVTVE
ncbi:MAG TPA: glutamine--fructose-6-phosphate transaminase (isomerizing) [Campylobacterales bacterium]|nr:glutamine--fructose-6-phosphate transaminase (isomerizing) [Campylobacterales bacterium]